MRVDRIRAVWRDARITDSDMLVVALLIVEGATDREIECRSRLDAIGVQTAIGRLMASGVVGRRADGRMYLKEGGDG